MKINYLKEILTIKDKILKYRPKIPPMQIQKYERDIRDLFDNLNNYNNNEIELEKAHKLAKAKLSSMKRVYGDIEAADQQNNDVKQFLDKETEIKLKQDFKIEEDDKFVSKYDEIRNMPGFNPLKVKEHHKQLDEMNKMYEEALNIVLKEKREEANQSGKASSNLIEKEVDTDQGVVKISKYVELPGEEKPVDYKEAIKRVLMSKGVEDPDSIIMSMNIDPLLDKKTKNSVMFASESGFEDDQSSNQLGDETDNLFEPIAFKADLDIPEEVRKDIRERVIRRFKYEENLKEEEKSNKIEREIFKEETRYINQFKVGGEIRPDSFGLLDINLYKDGSETRSSDESIQSKEDGVMTFVWRDGKLVEGKATPRNKTAYSNWYAGHFNPDDLRKQRELIDRQHFRGPLWDGIKPRSVLQDPIKVEDLMPKPREIPKEEDPNNEKNWGKHTWEDIDR